MKKSEMIEILATHIKGMGWETEDQDYYARKILSIMESNGMKPPGYQNENIYPYFDSINEWEPEDE